MGDTIPEIENSTEMFGHPLTCNICQEEVDPDGMIGMNGRDAVYCEGHLENADRLVTLERHGGYPNNNINPETGETGWLDDYEAPFTWYEITDEKIL